MGSPDDCASRASWTYFSAMWAAVPRTFTSGPLDSYDRLSGFGPLPPVPRLRPRMRFCCPCLMDLVSFSKIRALSNRVDGETPRPWLRCRKPPLALPVDHAPALRLAQSLHAVRSPPWLFWDRNGRISPSGRTSASLAVRLAI